MASRNLQSVEAELSFQLSDVQSAFVDPDEKKKHSVLPARCLHYRLYPFIHLVLFSREIS